MQKQSTNCRLLKITWWHCLLNSPQVLFDLLTSLQSTLPCRQWLRTCVCVCVCFSFELRPNRRLHCTSTKLQTQLCGPRLPDLRAWVCLAADRVLLNGDVCYSVFLCREGRRWQPPWWWMVLFPPPPTYFTSPICSWSPVVWSQGGGSGFWIVCVCLCVCSRAQ